MLEPKDLFHERMPKALPRPVKDGEFAGMTIGDINSRPPGAHDARLRLVDLDEEGIWGEVTFPSLGLWASEIKGPKLLREGVKAMNDWALEDIQGDRTAVPALTAMGYRNVMFGSDYPHVEGTFGHTQKTLHELFDGVEDAVRHRITIGAFLDLFPHVGQPPAA